MIKWLENGLMHHRVTIIISLKVNKKAVVRNRIRRVCLEEIEKNWLNKRSDKHYDVVIVISGI